MGLFVLVSIQHQFPAVKNQKRVDRYTGGLSLIKKNWIIYYLVTGMGNQILDILPEAIKVLAGVGFFAAIAKWIKKFFDKRKIAKKQKEDDRKMLVEVLKKLGMIEPKLDSINVKLKRLNENQKVILNMQNISFLVFDQRGNCEYASPALCQLIKYPESRIIGSGWLALLVETDIKRIKNAWNFAIENGSVFDEVFTYKDSKIKVHCIAFHKRDLKDSYDGSFAQFTKIEPTN